MSLNRRTTSESIDFTELFVSVVANRLQNDLNIFILSAVEKSATFFIQTFYNRRWGNSHLS